MLQVNKISFIIFFISCCIISSCRSPSSPSEPAPGIPYNFGLYDNFDSGSLRSQLWEGSAEAVTIDGNYCARLVQDGSGQKLIIMNWPRTIHADEFQEWSARVRVSSESTAKDFWMGLEYYGLDESSGWNAQLGLRIGRTSSWLFAAWKNQRTGESYYEILGNLSKDTWYNLKMAIIILSASQVKIDYYVDGQILASSIPMDGQKLIEHQITNLQRNLLVQIFSEPNKRGVGYFDDVYGVYGDTPFFLLRTQSRADTYPLFEEISLFQGTKD